MPLCRHCHQRPVSRPRGLCYACYYTPEIKALYPVSSKFATRGVGITADGRLPEAPTRSQPGTLEKVQVLEERAASGHALFHPGDFSQE